jgi:hypothetical protein
MAAKAAAVEERMRVPILLHPADARRTVLHFGWREPIPLACAPIGRIDINQTSRSSRADCTAFPSGPAL